MTDEHDQKDKRNDIIYQTVLWFIFVTEMSQFSSKMLLNFDPINILRETIDVDLCSVCEVTDIIFLYMIKCWWNSRIIKFDWFL